MCIVLPHRRPRAHVDAPLGFGGAAGSRTLMHGFLVEVLHQIRSLARWWGQAPIDVAYKGSELKYVLNL
jgi:hypothetical protein